MTEFYSVFHTYVPQHSNNMTLEGLCSRSNSKEKEEKEEDNEEKKNEQTNHFRASDESATVDVPWR